MMVCSNCKNSIPDESKYCPECGVKIEKKKLVLVCPNGHTDLPEDAKFCPECGELLSAKNDIVCKDKKICADENLKLEPNKIVESAKTNDRPPQIGDYYFSDGTWASKRIPNKICVGVVFSLETTEVEKSKGWTHGHIVALQDAEYLSGHYEKYGPLNLMKRWVTYQKTWFYLYLSSGEISSHNSHFNFNEKCRKDYDGYVYTNSGVIFGDVVDGIKKYPVQLSGKKTSGWYIPTIGQWANIIENLGNSKVHMWDDRGAWMKDIISRLNNYGLNIKPDGEYLSSTPKNNTDIWVCYIEARRFMPEHFSGNLRLVAAF